MRGPSRSVSRRSVLLGSAAVASAIALAGGAETTEAAEPTTPAQPPDLVSLGAEFARLRRRCARQGRRGRQLAARIEGLAMARGLPPVGRGKRHNALRDALRTDVGYHAAWTRWSASVDEIAALIDRIARHLDSAVRAVELNLDPAALAKLDTIFPGHKTAPEDYAW